MMRCCTTCGEGLRFWDRMKGRFDHPGCWQRNIVGPLPDDKHSDLPSWKLNVLFKLAQIFYPSDRIFR
jgi:hypothetical protein